MPHFYPRPPGGGRRDQADFPRRDRLCISIHALRVEGDDAYDSAVETLADFYPRPPGGGRHGIDFKVRRDEDFYPRPPGGGRLYLEKDKGA